MSCCNGNDDAFRVDSNGCFDCDECPKVKARFGLAWVSESPDCPCPEPVGWQVEFLDTPSKVEQKCQEMVRWINCPPLPRCDPCPPEELCPKRCGQQRDPCSCSKPKKKKKCCCCSGGSRKGNCFPPSGTPYCKRPRSPR